jgi:hypothetical protein
MLSECSQQRYTALGIKEKKRAMAGSVLCTVSSISLGIAGGWIGFLRQAHKDGAYDSG